MGAWFTRPFSHIGEDQSTDASALPPPCYDASLWMSSCRPTSSTRRFAPHTLLFQPDTRAFCPKGRDCPLLRISDHAEHFIHTTRDVLTAAVAKDRQEHPSTAVVNSTSTRVSIPFIRRCWSLEAGIGPGIRTPFPDGRTVVLWVHGFRQRFYPVVNMGNHLVHRFGASASDAPIVLMFLWPAYTNVLGYKHARANANLVRPRLTALLEFLRERRCPAVVVAHSMGCRAALNSLLRDNEADAFQNRNLCSHLLLIAAAVEANALSESGEFPRSRVCAARISVVSSGRDDVLRDNFPVGENLLGSLTGSSQVPVALGFSGPTLPIPGDVTHIDATDSLANHSPHMAIMVRDIQDVLFRAAGLSPPDEDASSTFDDELRSIASISNLADDEVFSLEEPLDDDGLEPGYEAENSETSVD